MADCPNCGAGVPEESKFCPECGRPLTAEASEAGTAVYDVPRRRLWPPDPLVLVVVLIAAGGVILLVGGRWAWGLAVLLLAGLVFLSQREVERRAARASLGALRERFSAHRDVITVRSRGQLELFRARRELAELEARRARGFQELGRAVFEEDKTGIEAAKTALGETAGLIEGKEAEIQALLEHIDARVREAQSGVQATEKMEAPPEPARVPEPWPPPDEGDPPAPAPVPEPSPADPSPAPEQPPSPQGKRKRRAKKA